MGRSIRWKSMWAIAKMEYVKWITNPRIIIVGVMLIFMKGLAVDPLLERAEKMQGQLSIFEPFVAIGNSGMLVMLLPCVFMILLGDYPILGDGMLFTVYRAKKINWFFGQVLFLLLAITTFLGAVMGASIAMSGGTWEMGWSDVVTKYNSYYPKEANNFASQLLPSNLYNQVSMTKAVIETFILFMAYLFLLALILYLFKLLRLEILSMASVCFVIGMGVVSYSLKQSAMWLFPMANAVVWAHYEVILRNQVYPVRFSILYFILCYMLLLGANLFVLSKMQFFGRETN